MSVVQWKMARRRVGHTTAVTIGAECFHLIANQGDDGSLGEVFIHWGKHGTSSAGLTNAYAVALSMGLRHRVPLPELIRPGLGQDFRPNGCTDDPEIPRVRSAVDYVARRLAIDWLPYADRAALGVFTRTERVRHRQLEAGHPALLGRLSDVETAQEPPGGVCPQAEPGPVRAVQRADDPGLLTHRRSPAERASNPAIITWRNSVSVSVKSRRRAARAGSAS
jgi:ribonucleoside-diphosphate reductase alpha chain